MKQDQLRPTSALPNNLLSNCGVDLTFSESASTECTSPQPERGRNGTEIECQRKDDQRGNPGANRPADDLDRGMQGFVSSEANRYEALGHAKRATCLVVSNTRADHHN